MREPRWLRPIARVYLIVTSAMWVTASALELANSLVGDGPRCEGAKDGVSVMCVARLPIWAAALIGLLGVLSAYLAARLTRPRFTAA